MQEGRKRRIFECHVCNKKNDFGKGSPRSLSHHTRDANHCQIRRWMLNETQNGGDGSFLVQQPRRATLSWKFSICWSLENPPVWIVRSMDAFSALDVSFGERAKSQLSSAKTTSGTVSPGMKGWDGLLTKPRSTQEQINWTKRRSSISVLSPCTSPWHIWHGEVRPNGVRKWIWKLSKKIHPVAEVQSSFFSLVDWDESHAFCNMNWDDSFSLFQDFPRGIVKTSN